MEINASYAEINKYVAERFNQPVTLSFVGEKEIKVAYTKRVWIKDLTIGVNLRIIDVQPASVTLSYRGMIGIDKIIEGAINVLKPTGVYLEDNNCIRINLSDIKKIDKVMEHVSLRDILAAEHGLTVDLSLKIPSTPVS